MTDFLEMAMADIDDTEHENNLMLCAILRHFLRH